MYWRISSFQELEHLPEEQRRALLKTCGGASATARLVARSIALGLIQAFAIAMLASPFLSRSSQIEWLFGACIVPCALISYQVSLIRVRGQLLIFLEQAVRRGEMLPMCLHCGYNLEGLAGNTCPECGKRIHGRSVQKPAPDR